MGEYRDGGRKWRLGAGCAGAEIAGESARGDGVDQVEAEAEEDAGEHDAGAEFRDAERGEHGAGEGSRLGGEGCMNLGKRFSDLGVEFGSGVEDEALQDKADGVER